MLHGWDAERLHDAIRRGHAGSQGAGVQASGDVHATERAGDEPQSIELEILRGGYGGTHWNGARYEQFEQMEIPMSEMKVRWEKEL